MARLSRRTNHCPTIVMLTTDNALWPKRFKHPFLVLVPPEGPGGLVCEYDVTLGQAALTRP